MRNIDDWRLWEYSVATNTWTERVDGPPPQPADTSSLYSYGLTFDAVRGETMLLVPSATSGSPETWSWDGVIWKRWAQQFPQGAVLDEGVRGDR